MLEFHDRFPQYAFDQNKGYATKAHYEGIECYGPCLLHRMTFLKKFAEEQEEEINEQTAMIY